MMDPAKQVLRLRDHCLQRLIEAYEEAGMSGLCQEGRWEYALDRVRSLSAEELLAVVEHSPEEPSADCPHG